jgi:hypothetical protein
MSDQLLKTILLETYSSEHLNRRLRKLRSHFVNQLFGEESAVEPDPFTDPIDIKWLHESLGEDFSKTINRNNVYQVFDDLQLEVKKLHPLITYFAYNFPESDLINIVQNLRKTYSPDLLLDVKIDPSLIAGCAFIVNGVYQDFSLRKQIDNNKEAILTEFTGYVNANK